MRTVIAAVLLALVIEGCGGSDGNVTVARVAGVGQISKSMFDHWLPIEAAILNSESGTSPLPKGALPDPPTYTNCIAYLRAQPQVKGKASGSSSSELRQRCAQQYANLKVYTLNVLLTWYWTLGKAARAGMKATDREVRERLKAVEQHSFKSGREYRAYLSNTNETTADMLLRSRVQLYEVKFQEQLSKLQQQSAKLSPARQQQILADYAKAQLTPKQWAAKTSCDSHYVTSGCKQYRGSLEAGIPN